MKRKGKTSTVRGVKRAGTGKSGRQSRQKSNVGSDAGRVITDRKTLQEAKEMVKWITDPERDGHWSLRRLARYTPWGAAGFGKWQHVAQGTGQVRLTRENFDALRRLYDLLQVGYESNMALLQLALETNEAHAQFSYRMNKLMLAVNEAIKAAR